MKALTISQPYASLISSGEKWIENRTWPTSYRGPLAIHAGKGLQYLDKESIKRYPTGCVIAICRLAACVELSKIELMSSCKVDRCDPIAPGCGKSWNDAAMHEHAEGPWCWILEAVRQIHPITMRGAQGLWDIQLPQTLPPENPV